MHKTMTTSCWCSIISHTKTWSGLEFEYGTMNVYIFLQPAIHLILFVLCVFRKFFFNAWYRYKQMPFCELRYQNK